MVVLTPNDQLRNTAYRITDHNFYIISQELKRAQQIMKKLAPESQIKEEKEEAKNDELDEESTKYSKPNVTSNVSEFFDENAVCVDEFKSDKKITF
jgi:hypothetical protein